MEHCGLGNLCHKARAKLASNGTDDPPSRAGARSTAPPGKRRQIQFVQPDQQIVLNAVLKAHGHPPRALSYQ